MSLYMRWLSFNPMFAESAEMSSETEPRRITTECTRPRTARLSCARRAQITGSSRRVMPGVKQLLNFPVGAGRSESKLLRPGRNLEFANAARRLIILKIRNPRH